MDKVMIIDDEVWVTEVIRNIIDWNSFGFQVARVCHDGEEAISEIRDIHPELLMTDIRMPGKTGLEIIREVSEKMPDILCVVISGYSDFEYARTALSCGAVGYLLKPIDQTELENVVIKARNILDQEKKQRTAKMQIQQEYQQTMDSYRDQFLVNCLEGHGESGLQYREINKRMKMTLEEGVLRLICLMLPDPAGLPDLFSEINKAVWKFQLPVLCSEVRPFIYRKKILILLNYPEAFSGKIRRCLRDLAASFQNDRRGIFFLEGEEFCDIYQMGPAYQKMRPLEFAGLLEKDCRFFPCEDIGEGGGKLLPSDLSLRLRQNIKGGNTEEARRTVREAWERVTARAGKNPRAFGQGLLEILEILESEEDPRTDFGRLEEQIVRAENPETVKEILSRKVCSLAEKRNRGDTPKEKTAVEYARDYIDNNYQTDITLTDIAEMVHLNANYFSDIFRRETGTAFKEYLTRVRMEAAKELLRKTGFRQAEVAARTGYHDVKHFARVFKKYVGISAAEYRKLMREL